MIEPLVPRQMPRRPYPAGWLLLAVAIGVAGWAPQSSPSDEAPSAPVMHSAASAASAAARATVGLAAADAPMTMASLAPDARPADSFQQRLQALPPSHAAVPGNAAAHPAGAHENAAPRVAAPRTTATRKPRPAEAARAAMLAEIAHMKRVLRLTPEQESYWHPVEAVLRDIAQEQAAAVDARGARASAKPGRLTIGDAEMRRLSSVAFPLVFALREDQKRDGMQFARAMGLDSIASAF